MESINIVELSGSVVDIYSTADYLAITLSIKKYIGMAKGDRNIKDYPRVVWYGETANKLADTITKYDNVNITATAEASLMTKDGKSVRRLIFVGKSIERARTKCEKYFELKPAVGDFSDYINIVRLRGTVIQIFMPDDTADFAKFVLKVAGVSSYSYPEVICYGHSAEYVRSSLSADESVSVIGTVQTYIKELENGERERRSSIVCREIAVNHSEE